MAAVDEDSTSAQTLIARGLEPSADSGQLNPKHRIFLSHSGADKNFVRHLCEHLERVHHYPFFDVCGDCFPKRKKFVQRISEAAQQCELAILVVSKKFFMSKRRMLELASFVEAQKFNNPRLEILPLFYGLTVAQLGEPGRQECWFKVWKKLAWSDKSGMIDMAKWRAALKVVGAANGLEFAVHGQNEVEYIKKIVAATCRLVPIDMRWNESHVQGKRRLRSSSHPTVSIPKDMAAVDEASTSAQTLMTGGLESSADSGQLNPKHRIFLSHSGADKNFVRHLCEHLERIHHYPFFDVRDDSLPKGMKFAQLIFQAAQQCQLAILVVSEKFFRSRWPMLELASFVEAQKSNNPRLQILPLFYGLTVAQFGEPERQERWFKKWEKLAQSDASGRIDTAKWRAALKVVGASNGLELAVYGKNEVEYIKKIVAATCRLVPINIMWNESHVQGKRHLRSASWRMFEKSVPSVKFGCRVVGLYGMGGIGKTTLCKSLCNDFFKEFLGKVCHLEISFKNKTKTPIESQKEVLQALTEASDELLKVITDIDKGQSLYVERIWRQKVFLSLENVWDSFEPLAEAAAYLEAKFSADSKILVTARSLNTLLKLGINRDSCFEMPHLEEDDAVALFLHYAWPGRSISDFRDPDELEVLRRCVRRALFGKGVASNSTSERHFHPLALRVLGSHFARTSPFPLGWIEKLNQFDWKRFEEVGDPIFSVLRTSYDALPAEMYRRMFLDAAIYAPRKPDNTVLTVKQLCKWLSIVYEEHFERVLARLEVLSSRALLFQWNNLSEAVSIHDLYREFAEFELREDNEDRVRLLHQGVDTVPKPLRTNGNCFLFERICIRNVGVESFDKAKLLRCSNLEVLKLDFCHALPNLDLQGLERLRTLELSGCFELTNLLHLWELKNLIWMRWNTCNFLRSDLVFPTSLETLELFGVSKSDSSIVVPPDIQGCKFLRELTLKNFPMLEHFPKLSGLKGLFKVDFGGCAKVKSLILDDQCYLRKLNLQNCKSLEILCLPPSCTTLMKLRCSGCESLVEIRNVTDCRKFQVFELEGCGKLMYRPANTLHTLTDL